jgi:hypothetical protein
MIMLIVASTLSIFLPLASAVDVTIISLTPSSGKVGTTVRIIGTVNTTDGLYRVWFAQQIVKETNASENSVNATFTIPTVPQGNYTITLQDVGKNINATIPFQVISAFYINTILMPTSPEQLQENGTVNIQVNATGGIANTVYSANITVNAPTPSNETYWALVTLTNTTTTGNGVATVVYPNDFQGKSRAPHTNYTGTYSIAFNTTMAISTFTIGLTNSTEYHRRQIVDIKAAGYKLNETVTIKITFGGKTINSTNVNATEGGLVLADWPVPRNASIGTYTLNVTSNSSSPTVKEPPDIQSFTVPGFGVNVTTENLAKEIVQGVKVQVFEDGKSIVNATSDSNGLTQPQMKLEIGNYTCKAFYKNATVQERSINITNAVSFIFYCNLTNLKISVIAVKDGINIMVPEAKIYLTRENKTLTTDINGTTIAHSLLPSVNYTLNVTRYGVSFNVTKLSTLLIDENLTAWYNMTFILPTLTLRVNVTNANGEPGNDAVVKVQELMGGILYENNTNNEGIAIFQCVFGKYNITIYDPEGIKLNETAISILNQTLSIQNVSISCKLWGLTLSIKVVDYFGQPISNVNVTLQQDDLAPRSRLTQSNGIATFSSISGGNIQITLYLSSPTQPYMVEGFFVDSSATIGIKLDKYVTLAGFLVETSSLITAILIIASVILVLSVEVYRRKRLKPQKKNELEPE